MGKPAWVHNRSIVPTPRQAPSLMADGRPIRAMVVDDSALMRKLVSQILRSGGIDVAATACDGEDALRKVEQVAPDVITLDIEMPRLNGVQFLERLMSIRPTPVLVLSSLTAEGADVTIECLTRGAVDCLQKPVRSIGVDIETIGRTIVERARAAAAARPRQGVVSFSRASGSSLAAPRSAVASRADRDLPVIAVAASTGGPAALTRFVAMLPMDVPAAIVIVQHLPVGFSRSLAARLDSLGGPRVAEAAEGDVLSASRVVVAPAGRHLAFDRSGRVTLNDEATLWGVRPAADIMMRSAAACFGRRVIGVVLTGMGRDGALGSRSIRQNGGYCLAQDEASCVVYGMPRAAVEAGGIDRQATVDDMAEILLEKLGAIRAT